jgi:hypothetical protein
VNGARLQASDFVPRFGEKPRPKTEEIHARILAAMPVAAEGGTK